MTAKELKKENEWLNYLKQTGVRQYESVKNGVTVFKGLLTERIKQFNINPDSLKNGKVSKYMRDPDYDKTPTTFYPERKL